MFVINSVFGYDCNVFQQATAWDLCWLGKQMKNSTTDGQVWTKFKSWVGDPKNKDGSRSKLLISYWIEQRTRIESTCCIPLQKKY